MNIQAKKRIDFQLDLTGEEMDQLKALFSTFLALAITESPNAVWFGKTINEMKGFIKEFTEQIGKVCPDKKL